MMQSKWIYLVALLGISFMSAAGCCDKEKQHILELQGQNSNLEIKNKVLMGEISQSKSQQAEWLAQLDVKDAAIAAKDAEISDLKKKILAPKPDDTEPGWKTTTIGDQVTVGSDLLFSSGRATLTSAGQQVLSGIVTALKGRYAALPIRVYGYTDSDPIKRTRKLWKDNLDLSANRAMAVTRYLISRGIKADRIETVAMGDTHFVSANSTRAGKSKNRRVEIFVVKK